MKTYRLKKDLPTFNAGDRFVLKDDGCLYLVDNEDGRYAGMAARGHWKKPVMAYHRTTLERFPNVLKDWFKEVADTVPIVKDRKIRHAIRAWVEAQDEALVRFDLFERTVGQIVIYGFSSSVADEAEIAMVEFTVDKAWAFERTRLTLEELIGEEED